MYMYINLEERFGCYRVLFYWIFISNLGNDVIGIELLEYSQYIIRSMGFGVGMFEFELQFIIY